MRLALVVALVLLYRQLQASGGGHAGLGCFGGILVLILLMPVNMVVTYFEQKQTEASMKQRDERTKLMSELLQAIRVIKLFSWEKPCMTRIRKVRAKEVGHIFKRLLLESLRAVHSELGENEAAAAAVGKLKVMGVPTSPPPKKWRDC